MGIVVGDPANSLTLALVCLLSTFTTFFLMGWFMYRRNLQPIRYRGPKLIAVTAFLLILREFFICIYEFFPLTTPCWLIIPYNNGLYQTFAVGVCRLWLLLFAYKIQQERVRIQERDDEGFKATSAEWFINHIYLVKKRILYPIVIFASLLPNILEIVYLREIPIADVVAYKSGDRNYPYVDPEYAVAQSKNFSRIFQVPSYVNFRDRCPSGVIDPDLYLYIMICYLLILLALIFKLRGFDKDKFYINAEFRLLGLWLFTFVLCDFLIVNVIFDEDFVYNNSPEQFNECLFILILFLISFGYPLYVSYYLERAKRRKIDFGDDLGETELLRSQATSEVSTGAPSTSLHSTPQGPKRTVSHGSQLGSEEEFNDYSKEDFKPLKAESGNSRRLLRYLKNKEFQTMFKKHLQLEFSIENYLCWIKGKYVLKEMRKGLMETKTMQTVLGNQSKEERIYAPYVFVNTFIREDSINQVNIPSKMRVRVEEAMEDLEMVSDIDPHAFNKAMVFLARALQDVLREVLKLMSTDSLARLKLTDGYKEWVVRTRADRKTIVVPKSQANSDSKPVSVAVSIPEGEAKV